MKAYLSLAFAALLFGSCQKESQKLVDNETPQNIPQYAQDGVEIICGVYYESQPFGIATCLDITAVCMVIVTASSSATHSHPAGIYFPGGSNSTEWVEDGVVTSIETTEEGKEVTYEPAAEPSSYGYYWSELEDDLGITSASVCPAP